MSGLPSSALPVGGAALDAALDYAAGLERMMGDVAMYLRVLARFRLDYRDKVLQLRAALDAGDLALALRGAHTLKGAASMIEAGRLRQLALDVETGLRAGLAEPALFDQLDAELARVIVRIDGLLPVAAAAPSAPAAQPLDQDGVVRLCVLLDLGDSAAQDFVADHAAALGALLGAARMARLEAAVAGFNFEEALRLLRPGTA